MLWVKAFHIIFVVSWFAGLLYLPRLFVYHADTTDQAGHNRFVIMEHKLFIIMTIAAILASILGLSLLTILSAYMTMGWMHAKLALYLLLLAYHFYCWKLKAEFARGSNTRSGRWYRLFNEVPALILIAIVILVVVKPF
ncbi:MAG: protoporphyrinogen oxidase HemJ [Gammaproteobacteria bacterium]